MTCYRLIFVCSIFFLFVGLVFPIKSKAATITCQKPLDVVIVIDNSSSIGEYQSGYSEEDKIRADNEWFNTMEFVRGFINGFEINEQYVHLSLVTFDGISMDDRILAPVRMSNGGWKDKYGGKDGFPRVSLPIPDLGDLHFSDTIINLATNRNVLTNGSGDGAFDKLKSNRQNRRANSFCYREPKEYFTNPKGHAPVDNQFKCGSTDIAAGLNRAKMILDSSPRKNDKLVNKEVILITDGIPDDDVKFNRFYKYLKDNGASQSDIDKYGYFDLDITDDDPLVKAAKNLKNDPVNPANIFAITVGKGDLCPDGISRHDCDTLLDHSNSWMSAAASDPKPSYKFDISDFSRFQLVLDSILKFSCGVEGVNINGFLLTQQNVKAKRSVYVNESYSYFGNVHLESILRSLSLGKYYINFD